jgi:hypothetical protein
MNDVLAPTIQRTPTDLSEQRLTDFLRSLFGSEGVGDYTPPDGENPAIKELITSGETETNDSMAKINQLLAEMAHLPREEQVKSPELLSAGAEYLTQLHAVYQLVPTRPDLLASLENGFLTMKSSVVYVQVMTGHPDLATGWGLRFLTAGATETEGSSIFKRGFSFFKKRATDAKVQDWFRDHRLSRRGC